MLNDAHELGFWVGGAQLMHSPDIHLIVSQVDPLLIELPSHPCGGKMDPGRAAWPGLRRRLQGALLQPDYYCPVIRGERPSLEVHMAANRDLPKLRSSCTTVVIAR